MFALTCQVESWCEEDEEYDELTSDIFEEAQLGGGPARGAGPETGSPENPKTPRTPRRRRSPTPVEHPESRFRSHIKLTSDAAKSTLGSARQPAPLDVPPPVVSTPKKPRKTILKRSNVNQEVLEPVTVRVLFFSFSFLRLFMFSNRSTTLQMLRLCRRSSQISRVASPHQTIC